MYFVDMLPEIIFVYLCLFCDSQYYVQRVSLVCFIILGLRLHIAMDIVYEV